MFKWFWTIYSRWVPLPGGSYAKKYVYMYVCKNGAWFLKGRQMQAILKHQLMPVPHEFGSSFAAL